MPKFWRAVQRVQDKWPEMGWQKTAIHVSRYCGNGALSIDNNLSERMVRPVAIGRKNYLFMGSTINSSARDNVHQPTPFLTQLRRAGNSCLF
jgi:hypothetical protein